MPRKKAQTEEERRAEDQDAALEKAFVEGALPEEDRRADAGLPGLPDGKPPEIPIDIIPPRVPRPDGPLTTDELLAKLRVGETALYELLEFGPRWTVRKGTYIGQSKTLERAIRLVGAYQAHDPNDPTKMIMVDLFGNIIPVDDAV